jgi:two-component system nitrogen regulation response regulator GlnG
VIFITAHGTTDTAIEAMKGGAFDYLTKPVDLGRLSQIISRAFDAARLMRVPALLPAEMSDNQIVGHTAVMQEMCKAIGRVAPQDVNVLILGESGTGKELVARALYHHSKRAERPFLAINCAALPETLLESELFGHEQGAFTGAIRRRIGKFEQCSGGTLFLDEIGDMTPGLQAKMLRVLQEQKFERLGGNQTVQTHVRVLAATNQDLEKAVALGRFRKDLYYRLKGVTIRVPPLRERLEDVPELAHHFLFRFNRELGMDYRAFAPEAVELLGSYPWPGNVRELQGAVQVAMLHGSGHVLVSEFLPEEIARRAAGAADLAKDAGEGVRAPLPLPIAGMSAVVEALLQEGGGNLYPRAVQSLDRALLEAVLRLTGGNQTQASELLGISRNTLRQKMKSLGFAIDKVFTQSSEESEENSHR